MGDDHEWDKSGSFVKKPTTGWLHDDAALMHGDGIYYPVKYVGCIPMEKSMRTLSHDERTAVTREAITLCCEAAGIRPLRKRQVTKLVREALLADPVVRNLNVKFTISTTGVALVVMETNQVIANHIMPCISFATGGDASEYDMIGYVAKDARNARDCHVFDCGHMAQDIIATIGQAFELRYKAFLRKQQGSAPGVGGVSNAMYRLQMGVPVEDQSTYDDLPSGGFKNPRPAAVVARATGQMYGDDDVIYDNRAPASQPLRGPPMYDRGDINASTGQYGTLPGMPGGYVPSEDYDDVMDDVPISSLMQAPGGAELNRPLNQEIWFHGQLSREAADSLLRKNGDFLVRESTQARNQYVLSSLQAGERKHLLLVDPAGRVRTRDMAFESVSHLVNYHIRARLPIISRGNRCVLGDPVARALGQPIYDSADTY